MERVVDDALLERVVTYIPFVVYDGKARWFVLDIQRGYVDAAGLELEHQHVRFTNLFSAVMKGRNIESAWQALEHSEHQAIHLISPETTEIETRYEALKKRLSSKMEMHRQVALVQFVTYEGHGDMCRIERTWRLLQLVAATVKGGSRALQWSANAWQLLSPEEQNSWTARFGPSGSKPNEVKKQIEALFDGYLDDHPYLNYLAICQKRCDLLAFHAVVLKNIGQVPKVTEVPGVTWASCRALRAIVDRDDCPFPLALVPLFVEDGDIAFALRDYLGFWRGEKPATVFKRWDGPFWQSKPTAVFYATLVVQRYARLKSSLVRFVPFHQPKRGSSCPCQTTALYCKDCLELKSIPNFSHPPPGRSIALDMNANKVVCQLCKSPRIIRVPLFNSLNPSTSLSISHPDRFPLHICNGSPLCFVKTSYVGSCRACDC